MFLEGVNILLRLSVPESDCSVVSSGHNEPAIGREPGTPDPVAMTTESELELLTINCPHLMQEK